MSEEDDRIISIDLNSNGNKSISSDNTTQSAVTTIVTPNYFQKCSDFFNDQDNIQKMTVVIAVILELYRVMVSSLLVLFVPQNA